MKQLITLNQLISKYLMILIIVFSCIAYIVPSYFSWAIAYTPFLLGIAMFGMGLTIKFESLCNNLWVKEYCKQYYEKKELKKLLKKYERIAVFSITILMVTNIIMLMMI